MHDINKKTLSDAFAKLPTYSPPTSQWSEINQALNDAPFKNAVKSLPTYAAPDLEMVKKVAIIEQEIPNDYWFLRLPKISLKAAAAVLIFGLLYYVIADKFLNNSTDLKQEIVEIYALPESTTNEEFSEIMQLCEAEAWVCEKPKFKELKSDYKELENAQSELTAAMQTYGEDLNLIKQFNEIERQKALILNDLSLFI